MSDWNDDDGWETEDPFDDGNDLDVDEGSPSTETTSRALLGITAVSIGLVVGAFVIGTASAVVLLLVLEALGVPVLDDVVLLSIISTVTLQGVGMLGISAWYLSRYDYGFGFVRLRRPTLRQVGWVVVGVFGTFAASIGAQNALSALGFESSQHEVVEMATATPEILLVMVPLSFLLIGPGEELLFRGIIQTKFVDQIDVLPGLVLASALFAVVHIPAYGGFDSMPTIVGLFFISLVLGGLYEYTENLFVPIVVHGAFNAIQFGVLYFVLTSDAEMALVLF